MRNSAEIKLIGCVYQDVRHPKEIINRGEVIMDWLKENLLIVLLARLVGALLICTILFLAYAGFTKERGVISIKLEDAQLARLKELSKQDFRDVEHTMLMLADQYIEYNNEVKK